MKDRDAEPLFTTSVSSSGDPVVNALEITATLLPKRVPSFALCAKL